MNVKLLIVVGVVSLLFFVVALFPANLAWEMSSSTVSEKLPGKVEAVGGTIWDGFLRVHVDKGPVAGQHVIVWKISPLSLFLAKLSLALDVQGVGYELEGTGYIGLGGSGVEDLSGKLGEHVVNGALSAYRVKVEKGIRVDAVSVGFGDNTVTEAGGQIKWPGGPITFQVSGSAQSVDYPPVKGVVAVKSGEAVLTLSDAKTKGVIVELGIKADGMAKVKVLQRALSLTGIDDGKGDDDKVLMDRQQPVF